MKINFTKWSKGTFNTPHISVIVNEEYTQISFVVINYHWWIIINKK
jgi:hypothetical protein